MTENGDCRKFHQFRVSYLYWFTSTPPFLSSAMSRFFRHADDSDSDTESSEEELISSGDEDVAPARPAAAAKPMSRFLKTAGSDSDSSSSSSDSDSDQESDDDDKGDDSSEDGVKRAPKSAKDKRLEEMEGTGKVMDNALRINDWIAISTGECTESIANRSNCLQRIR